MKVYSRNFSRNETALEKTSEKKNIPARGDKRDSDVEVKNGNTEGYDKLIQAGRSIARNQAILNGFERIKNWLDEGKYKPRENQLLAELTEKNRFEKEKVLDPYRRELSKILDKNDAAGLERLIQALNEEVRQSLAILGYNQIKVQNVLATAGPAEKRTLNILMTSIKKSLQERGNQLFNISSEKAIDLLD